jgi:hypothetical protein
MLNSRIIRLSIYLTLSAVFFVFRLHSPMSILTIATADDAHFIQQGISIVSGRWLGEYTQWTLIKGPGFPIFLALNAAIGMPITLTVAVVYALACLVLALSIGKVFNSSTLTVASYGIMLFNPYAFPSRALRDLIYTPVSLIVLALCIFLIDFSVRKKLPPRWFWVVFGFCIFYFWIIREEGVWLLPAILGALAYFALRSNVGWKVAAKSLLVLSFSFALPLSAILTLNFLNYGAPVVQEFTQGSFSKAASAISSVDNGARKPFVPSSHEAREAIATVSQEFEFLNSYMNNEGEFWEEPGCDLMPSTCGEIGGGWLPFALRDAAAARGAYSDGGTSEKYWSGLAADVNQLCQRKKLECGGSLVPYLPSINSSQITSLPVSFAKGLFLSLGNASIPPRLESQDPILTLNQMRYFLGEPRTVEAPGERIVGLSGWFAPDGSDAWLGLECVNPVVKTINIPRLASPGLIPPGKNEVLTSNRFSVEFNSNQECSLINSVSGEKLLDLNENLITGGIEVDAGTIWIDFVNNPSKWNESFSQNFLELGQKILLSLNSVFLLLGLSALLFSLIKFRTSPWWFIGSSKSAWFSILLLLVAIVCRLAILAIIDVSSFPAFAVDYLNPTPVLLSVFCLLFFVATTTQIRGAYAKNSSELWKNY